jgi:hypothetical protein
LGLRAFPPYDVLYHAPRLRRSSPGGQNSESQGADHEGRPEHSSGPTQKGRSASSTEDGLASSTSSTKNTRQTASFARLEKNDYYEGSSYQQMKTDQKSVHLSSPLSKKSKR